MNFYQIAYPDKFNLKDMQLHLGLPVSKTGSFLRQLVSILPYIASYFDGVWLLGVWTQQRQFGRPRPFEVVNHFEPDPELWGTLDDLNNFIQEAHEHGLEVMVDFVPNHAAQAGCNPANAHVFRECSGCQHDCAGRKCFPMNGKRYNFGGYVNVDDSGHHEDYFQGTVQRDFSRPEGRQEVINIARSFCLLKLDWVRGDMLKHIDHEGYPKTWNDPVPEDFLSKIFENLRPVRLLGEVQPGQNIPHGYLDRAYFQDIYGAGKIGTTVAFTKALQKLKGNLETAFVWISHHDHAAPQKAFGKNWPAVCALIWLLPCMKSMLASTEYGYAFDWETSGLCSADYLHTDKDRMIPMDAPCNIQWEKTPAHYFWQELFDQAKWIRQTVGKKPQMHLLPFKDEDLVGYGIEGNGKMMIVLGNLSEQTRSLPILGQNLEVLAHGYVVCEVNFNSWQENYFREDLRKTLAGDDRVQVFINGKYHLIGTLPTLYQKQLVIQSANRVFGRGNYINDIRVH